MTEQSAKQKELRKHFIQTVYKTLEGVLSPTPYLAISEGDRVDVKFLNGKPRLPKPGTTEITILDLDLAKLFFDDFHLLYEGDTGVGKTFTSDALFGAVFGPEGHYTIRLSGGILGSSALEPFTTTHLVNGIPKTHLDPEKCQKYGALFIDEITRGDNQEVFQVVDGVIHINGNTGYLRIPIPGTERYKGLAIIAAMNPPDALHSGSLELDIAGENRFLKFKFPNGVAEAGSSQLEKRITNNLHEQFWNEFEQRTGRTGGWKQNYPLITDPEQLQNNLDGETKEFLDVALGYVGYDPKETYKRNAELLEEGGITPVFSVREDNDYTKILEAQGKLKHSFVRRDLRKIRDLSQLLAFIKGVKNETYDTDVKINDVAASLGIVLESKAITGTDPGSLMALVNDARAAYADLHKETKTPEGYGIRQAVWQEAVYTGIEHGFDGYQKTLRKNIQTLNSQAPKAAQATIRSRILADLVVLDHFSKKHETQVRTALEKKEDAFEAFDDLYAQKKAESSIYEHRLESILR